MDIDIPDGDPVFEEDKVIPFKRSGSKDSDRHKYTPRQQINTQSAYLDLTNVYGAT